MHDVHETRVGKRRIQLVERCLPLTLPHLIGFVCLSAWCCNNCFQSGSTTRGPWNHYRDLSNWALIKLNLRIFLLEVFAEVILMDPKGKRGRCFTVRAPSWRTLINSDGRDFGREARAPMFREQGVRHSKKKKWERYATWSAWLRIFFAVWCESEIGAWSMSINHQEFISIIWKIGACKSHSMSDHFFTIVFSHDFAHFHGKSIP